MKQRIFFYILCMLGTSFVTIYVMNLYFGLIIIVFSFIIFLLLYQFGIKNKIDTMKKHKNSSSLIHKIYLYSYQKEKDDIKFEELTNFLNKDEKKVIANCTTLEEKFNKLNEYYNFYPFAQVKELIFNYNVTTSRDIALKNLDSAARIYINAFSSIEIYSLLDTICLELLFTSFSIFLLKFFFYPFFMLQASDNKYFMIVIFAYYVLTLLIIILFLYKVFYSKKDNKYYLYCFFASSLATMGVKTPFLSLEDTSTSIDMPNSIHIEEIIQGYKEGNPNTIHNFIMKYNYDFVDESMYFIYSLIRKNGLKNNDYLRIESLLDDYRNIEIFPYKRIKSDYVTTLFFITTLIYLYFFYLYLIS